MNKQMVFWIGLMFVCSFLLAACSGTTPTSQVNEPISAASDATEELEPTETVVTEEPEPTESVDTEEPKPTKKAPEEEPESTSLLTGDTAPDFTLPDSNGNEVSLADSLKENEQVVLVFYFGYLCQPCMAQLSEIENDRTKYEEAGSQVIAIAVQGNYGAKTTAKVSNAQFPILADNDRIVAEAYGVLDEGLSTPSVFIINKDRQIVWREITHIEGSGCGTNRIPSQTILENLG
jgi:peroxiredoxin